MEKHLYTGKLLKKEFKTASNGKPFVTFNLEREFTKQDGTKQKITHRVSAFGEYLQGVLANQMNEGSIVCIEANISPRAYTDSNTGEVKAALDIIANSITMVWEGSNVPGTAPTGMFNTQTVTQQYQQPAAQYTQPLYQQQPVQVPNPFQQPNPQSAEANATGFNPAFYTKI